MSIQQELASCKAKLIQLQIKDMNKVLPLTKTSIQKNEVFVLNEMMEKFDFDEERELDQVKGNLRVLKTEVSKLMNLLKGYNNSQEYLNRIENISNSIADYVQELKGKMAVKFEEFVNQEEQLTEELQNFENRMDNFEIASQQPVVKIAKRKVNEDENEQSQSELGILRAKITRIEEKMDAIQLLPAEDQKEFLRVRTKHKGKVTEQFINDCLKAIPLITEEQLVDYAEIYSEYLDLEDEKKYLLAKYKSVKQDQQEILKEELKIQELNVKKQKAKPIIPLEVREKQKEEIKQWKQNKITCHVVHDIHDELTQAQRKEQELKFKQEQELKKQQVEFYRQQKQIQKMREQELSQMETMTKRFVSQDALQRIKQKEESMVEKKRSILERKQQQQYLEELKQQARQEDKQIKYHYIESKVTEPTKAAEMQKRTKFDSSQGSKTADTFGGNLLGMGRRAVPQWRQNL